MRDGYYNRRPKVIYIAKDIGKGGAVLGRA